MFFVMKHEILNASESSLISALTQLGNDLVLWRDNELARNILSKKDLKLQADRWAHDYLFEHITKLWPNIPIISEEDVNHSEDRPIQYWLIDPIDGSASWLNGFDGFVTQAALIEDCVPVTGFIYAPIRDLLYVGKRGKGAYLNERRLSSSGIEDKITIVDNTPIPHGVVKALIEKYSMRYRESGSLGLKACMVASGEADVFVKDVLVRDWDLAPAAVLLREVGCALVQINGQEFPFSGAWEKDSGFIVARSLELAESILTTLNSGEINDC